MISLPPPTKMFPFGGFPSRAWGCQAPDATGLPVAGVPIRGSRVRRLPAPPPGISPLAAPFFGARAESSTARRRAMAPREEPAWYMLWAASAHRGSSISPSRISPKGPHRRGTPNPLHTPHQNPRGEVIQPHLPVRLPCYDFSPLAEAGFDPPSLGIPSESRPHPAPARVKRRAVCARSRDVFTARC